MALALQEERVEQITRQAEQDGGRVIQRESRQPRFQDSGTQDSAYLNLIWSTMNWAYRAHLEEPVFNIDTRQYDSWMIGFSQNEPHLAGILNSVVEKDKNRGWTLTGGVRQVARFTERLRNVEDGAGWRAFIQKQALSFYTANIGAITELELGEDGILLSMYHVDPTRCAVTGKREKPLRYYPAKGKPQTWERGTFFKTVSMPDIREDFHGVGLSAVNRALMLAKMMVAIYEHDLELLGARPPKGFVVGTNVTSTMYENAKKARQRAKEQDEPDFDILALFADSPNRMTDLKFVPFSQLPAEFDIREWTEMLMLGYALCFGYDAEEFYPVRRGQFGGGKEADLQSQKAASKGELSFILSFEDNVQRRLPSTLDFGFDRADPKIELQRVQVDKAKAELYKMLYESPVVEGGIDREEYRILLATANIIPHEWTDSEEDTTSTDTTRVLRSMARDNINVRRAAQRWGNEPIVRYRSSSNSLQVLFLTGDEMLRRQLYPVSKPTVARKIKHTHPYSCGCEQCLSWYDGEGREIAVAHQYRGDLTRREALPGDVLYEEGDVKITTGDVERAIEEAAAVSADLGALLKARSVSRAIVWVEAARRYRNTETGQFLKADYVRALVQVSLDTSGDNANALAAMVANKELSPADYVQLFKEDIKREYIRQYLAGIGGQGQMNPTDWGSIGGMLSEQYSYLKGFLEAIEGGNLTEAQIAMRARMYIASAREAFERAGARALGIDLPYYPGDGTTLCLTSCKCYWDIVEVRNDDGLLQGYNCYWRRSAAESCDTCIARAGEYNPLYVAL